MSARMDRSLVLAWGVGLALCGAGGIVTSAAVSRRNAETGGTPILAATSDSTIEKRGGAVAANGGVGCEGGGVRCEGSSDSLRPPTSNLAPPASVDSAPSPLDARLASEVKLAPRDPAPSVRTPLPRARAAVQAAVGPAWSRDTALTSALRDTVRRVLDRALADSAFPGAYAVIGTSRGIVAEYAVGRIDWAAGAPAPSSSTIWDLASLTKVVGLTSAVARLVDGGTVRLDAPVQRYLPEFAGRGKERVTVRHLLTHSSGLPSWRPLHKEAETPEARRALVLATPLDTAPGVRYAYSDLGAITLGLMVERLTKRPLDAYLAERVFRPLGMGDTGYRPDSSVLARVAPTEIDPWRQRHLRGEVHDENAWALGGVSGHAGLFGTGHDLARFARMYLNGGSLEGQRVLSREVVRRFTTRQDSALSHRALGWETANGENSGGRLMGRRAFGHTGFTGTSIWMDPERDLFVILLSNRVNPSRQNTRIGRVRVALADAVVQVVAAQSGKPAAPLPSVPRP